MESKILIETDGFILNNQPKPKSTMIEEYLYTEKVKDQAKTLSELCDSMDSKS